MHILLFDVGKAELTIHKPYQPSLPWLPRRNTTPPMDMLHHYPQAVTRSNVFFQERISIATYKFKGVTAK
jgi:hypothetical protein